MAVGGVVDDRFWQILIDSDTCDMMWQVVVCLDDCARAINDQGEMATGCWRFEPVPFPAADPSAKRRRGDSQVSHDVWAVLARIHPSAASVQPSIHPSIHPCMHACMHACIQLAKRKQTDSQMYAPRATWILTWIAWIAQGYHSFFCFSFVFQPGFVAFVAFVASGFCGFCGFCGCGAFVALPCLSYLSTYLSDLTCFNLT